MNGHKDAAPLSRSADNDHVREWQPAGEDMSKGESKGEQTRRTILSRALSIVSEVGYEGLSIGVLAEETQLSKSGLFAHFKSKEALQLGVIQEVISRFTLRVVQPALAAPRGEPRLRVLFDKKLEWIRGEQELRGCLLQKGSLEYHNRLGHPVRERLVQAFQDWWELVIRCAQTAIDEGHFRGDLEPEQFGYEFDAITMMYQQRQGLMRDRAAGARAQTAFESLLDRSRRSPRPR
jgi:AcrR family transcriptional regulator